MDMQGGGSAGGSNGPGYPEVWHFYEKQFCVKRAGMSSMLRSPILLSERLAQVGIRKA